jgi:flagellar hook assembly protein FlgD
MGAVQSVLDRLDLIVADPLELEPDESADLVAFVRDALVQLLVYDAAGRRVRRLVSGASSAGLHDVPWDGRDDAGRAVASGAYLIRLVAPGGVATQRVTLLR